MSDRTVVIEALRSSEARLAGTVAALSEPALRAPSRLPDWSVAQVIAHLAANADSVTRRLRGMSADLVVDQYPGGAQGRAEEIDRRAGQDAPALAQDLRIAVSTMFEVIDSVPDPVWDRRSRNVSGGEIDGDALLGSRWQEVEIHHADLGQDYTVGDWPVDFVSARLPHLLSSLPPRSDGRQLLAWITGRGPAPELSPW